MNIQPPRLLSKIFEKYTASQKHESYSISKCWTNFWQPTILVQQNIFIKTLIEFVSLHIYASFGTFCVQIGQFFEAQWDFKLSEEFDIEIIFLRKKRCYRFQTFFKGWLCLEKLTNLNAKGAKRSVKMWATNFYKSFFQKYFFVVSEWLVVKNSFSTYVWSKVNSCFCEAV